MILKVLSPMSKMRLPADGGSAIRIFWHCVTNKFFFLTLAIFLLTALLLCVVIVQVKPMLTIKRALRREKIFVFFLFFSNRPVYVCMIDTGLKSNLRR